MITLTGCTNEDEINNLKQKNETEIQQVNKEFDEKIIELKVKNEEELSVFKNEVKDLMKKNSELEETINNNEVVGKIENNDTIELVENLQYHSIDLQTINGIFYFDGTTAIYSLPINKSLSVNKGVSSKVNVINLVLNQEEEIWALIEVFKYRNNDENAFGYVPISTISRNDNLTERINEKYVIAENIEIGQTLDDAKLHFGLNYIHSGSGNSYIFYPVESDYKTIITDNEILNKSRAAFENAVVMSFTSDFNQLYRVEITSSNIVLISGYTIDSPAEEVISYYEENYVKYASENFVAQEHYKSYSLNDEYVISIRLNDGLEKIESIIIERNY
jgi:hypothetical protein